MTHSSAWSGTDTNGNIQWSGHQPAGFYEELWHTISSGRVWHGEMINRRKDGSFYREEMRITPVRTPGAGTRAEGSGVHGFSTGPACHQLRWNRSARMGKWITAASCFRAPKRNSNGSKALWSMPDGCSPARTFLRRNDELAQAYTAECNERWPATL